VGHFLHGRPSSTLTPAHPHTQASLPAITASPSLTDGAYLSALSFPKSSPALSRVSSPTNSQRRAGHPSSARTTSMCTCPPASMSCRVGYGAQWHPIAAARCSTAARRCSNRDARTRSSTMRSQAGCLVPPHPILSLLADDCGPYRHLTSTASSPFRCSAVPSLHDRDVGARSSTMISRVAPLLPPSLLTLRAARLASSSLAPRRVGTMRWHARVCCVPPSIRPLV
jgi:hypothetical protein